MCIQNTLTIQECDIYYEVTQYHIAEEVSRHYIKYSLHITYTM